MGTPLFVGSEPNRMAMSNDGQYLYVGIDGASTIRRVNLISYTAEFQIPLGSDGSCGLIVAADMVVLQDDPHALAVVRDNVGYAGLGARVHDSGDNQWSGRITKQGRRDLRYAMVQAAHNAIDHPKGARS